MNFNRKRHLEKLLRQARQQVFDRDSRTLAIKWLKRELAPYWKAESDSRPDNSAMSATHGW